MADLERAGWRAEGADDRGRVPSVAGWPKEVPAHVSVTAPSWAHHLTNVTGDMRQATCHVSTANMSLVSYRVLPNSYGVMA